MINKHTQNRYHNFFQVNKLTSQFLINASTIFLITQMQLVLPFLFLNRLVT